MRDLFRTEQAILEVGPEGDAELATGLLQAGKRVATAAAVFAASAAADLAPFYVLADVALTQTMPRPGLCRVEFPRRTLAAGRHS